MHVMIGIGSVEPPHWCTSSSRRLWLPPRDTVSSHNCNSQDEELRVSNPVSKYIEPCAKPW